MDEAEWLTGNDHRLMMHYLGGQASPRKLQLFTCACLRRVKWYDPEVIGLIECYADRRVTRREAMAAVKKAAPDVRISSDCSYLFWKARCHYGADVASAFCVQYALSSHGKQFTRENLLAEEQYHADLIHDVFGNPFRPVAFDLAWRTTEVLALATAAYENRTLPAGTLEPERLTVLADALEESDCDQTELLGHLRSPGPHVRGCWPVDLILSKDRSSERL